MGFIRKISRARNIKGFFSPFIHYIKYMFEKPTITYDKCMLILSVDIDVGNRIVSILNKGKNDIHVHDDISEYNIGRMEEEALPLIINFFNDLEIPVTFAVRGQLFNADPTIIDMLVSSPVKHDIGSHSYSHRDFTKLSYGEADKELKMVSDTMRKFKISPKSFIFPRNKVAYLNLLEKYGYKCYRDYGKYVNYGAFINDGRYIKKIGRLYDVHPSLYIGYTQDSMLIKKIIDLSIKDRVPLHLWFHPWNLGKNKILIQKRINNVFFPLFNYAKLKEKKGELKIETMLSAAEKIEIRACEVE